MSEELMRDPDFKPGQTVYAKVDVFMHKDFGGHKLCSAGTMLEIIELFKPLGEAAEVDIWRVKFPHNHITFAVNASQLSAVPITALSLGSSVG